MTDLIEALPAVKDLTLEDKEDIVAARTAYGNLTDDQKDYVTKRNIWNTGTGRGADRKTSGCSSG